MLSVETSIRFIKEVAEGNKNIVKILEQVSRDCEGVEDSDR